MPSSILFCHMEIIQFSIPIADIIRFYFFFLKKVQTKFKYHLNQLKLTKITLEKYVFYVGGQKWCNSNRETLDNALTLKVEIPIKCPIIMAVVNDQ